MQEAQGDKERLEAAFQTAIDQVRFVLNCEINNEPDLVIVEDSAFLACAEASSAGITVYASTGIVKDVSDLMAAAWQDEEFLQIDDGRPTDDFDGLVDVALTWLFLHEIMHAHLDHFAQSGKSTFVEAGDTQALGLVSIKKSTIQTNTKQTEQTEHEAAVSKCLELQADNDATDIFLELYAEDRWNEIRQRAAAAAAIMVLIEQADLKQELPSQSHPKSATRFFLLLAHLSQMWIYPHATLTTGDVGQTLDTGGTMTPEMFEGYAKRVIAPAVNDAVILAIAGEAQTFLNEIKGPAPLLQDLYAVQWMKDLAAGALKTEAGREWFELTPINRGLLSER